MKKTRKRTKTTKVNNDDLPYSDKEFLAWVDRVTSKPINKLGIQTHKKKDWVQAKDFKKSN
jgi:hypothetical protein